jgi:hypothetical protein
MKKFTKEEVRAWLNRRHVSREPVPDRERLLQQLVCKTADCEDSGVGMLTPSEIKLNDIFTAIVTGGASVPGEATARRSATPVATVAPFDMLSENLLSLYQLSRGTTASEFLEKAISLFVQEFDIYRVRWGSGPQEMRGEGPSSHQARDHSAPTGARPQRQQRR